MCSDQITGHDEKSVTKKMTPQDRNDLGRPGVRRWSWRWLCPTGARMDALATGFLSVGRLLMIALACQGSPWLFACSTVPSSRTTAEVAADDSIAKQVKEALLRDPRIYDEHIEVTADRS